MRRLVCYPGESLRLPSEEFALVRTGPSAVARLQQRKRRDGIELNPRILEVGEREKCSVGRHVEARSLIPADDCVDRNTCGNVKNDHRTEVGAELVVAVWRVLSAIRDLEIVTVG